MALDDILLDAEEKMIKSTEVIQAEFAGVRTGKASPDLVTNLMVEAYGSHMRLKELAAVTTPDARLILIQPWDASQGAGGIEAGNLAAGGREIDPAAHSTAFRGTAPGSGEGGAENGGGGTGKRAREPAACDR
jgi:hypothetical protein